MRVTAPDAEGKPHTYHYEHEKLTLAEGDKLELQAGIGYLEFSVPDLKKFRTWRAIIWLCRMRDGEKDLRYEDVDAVFSEVEFLPDPPKDDDEGKARAATRNGKDAAPRTGTSKRNENSPDVALTGSR